MNFNRKLKTLAVALVAATASQMSFASLLHANPGTGNGSFFFVAANDEGDSFIQSLANLNGNFRMDSATPITEQDFTLGASLASVIAGSNPVWTVIAGDSAAVPGQGIYANVRLNVGVTPDTTAMGGPASMRNAAIVQSLQDINSFVSGMDSNLATVAGTGVYDPGADGQPTDVANFVLVGPAFSLNGRAPTEGALLSIGAALDAWLIESDIVTQTNLPQGIRFAALTQLGQWRFDGPTLHYGVIPAAPVPVPAAVWLLGSALAGMTGLRRRKA